MRLLRRLFLPLSVVVLVWAALVVPLPVLLEFPDDPVSLDGAVIVHVEGAALNGDYLLSTVRLRRGTVAGLVQAAVSEGAGLQPDTRLIPPGEDDRAYFARQRDVFSVAAEVAAAVGLRAAGYDADPERIMGSGVLVVDVLPGAPADGVLNSGDVIVEVDGRQVSVVDDLRAAIAGGPQGPRSIRFLRGEEPHDVEIQPADVETAEGVVQGIGVRIQTHEPRVDLPAAVEIDAGPVGGPSAGLMIALTVYDKATPSDDLAAGRTIAGTGSVDATGTVGRVGGIQQKVLAAHRLGAEVFLVPWSQHERARDALPPGSGMALLPVSTFDEALDVLATATTATRPAAWTAPQAA